MTLQRFEFMIFDAAAVAGEAFCQFLLLLDREQKISLYTDDQGPLDLDSAERTRNRCTVIGNIEQVARA